MNEFADKIVCVTGSARGIGREIAVRFLDEGATVIFNYRKDTEAFSEMIEDLKTRYPERVHPIKADIASEDEIKAMFDEIKRTYKRLDVLVNNAGITADALALMMSAEKWDSVVNVNLRGTFLCSKSALWMMSSKKTGCILNIASISGLHATPGQANYGASKAGIIMLTKVLAKEYGKYGIRINSIAPGFIDTDMTSELPEDVKENYMSGIALNKFGSTRDIAEAALFLCSDRAAYITGHCLVVDGGLGI